MRTWNLRSLIKRYYIEKKSGKLRPIGAPNIEAKIMHRFIADMISNVIAPTRTSAGDYDKDIRGNHAYRKNLGAHTAVRDIVRAIKKGISKNPLTLRAYEFDLKSFFNMVPWSWIKHVISERLGKDMGLLVMSILKNIRYRFEKPEDGSKPDLSNLLKDEKELKYKHMGYTKGKVKKPVIYRDGMPQGSPLSPVLATVALENWEFPEGLVLYADDGVYIGEDFSPLRRFLWELNTMGIEIAPEKSMEIDDVFLFLGFTISLKSCTIGRPDLGQVNFMEIGENELMLFLKSGGGIYGNKENPEVKWEWDIKEGSAAQYAVKSQLDNPKDMAITMYKGLWMLEHKKYKYTPGEGMHKFMQTSSEGWSWLASFVANSCSRFERKRIKRLKFPQWLDHKWESVSKKDYIELNPTVDVVPFEIYNDAFIMPKAAFLEEYNPEVGNWEENPDYLSQHGITLIEEIPEKAKSKPEKVRTEPGKKKDKKEKAEPKWDDDMVTVFENTSTNPWTKVSQVDKKTSVHIKP
jgi:hypothetical protein